MVHRARVLVVVVAAAAAVVGATAACDSPGLDPKQTVAVTESTGHDSSRPSLPEQGDIRLTVEGDVVEVVDPAALVLGGGGSDEVLVVMRLPVDVRSGTRVEVTGVAQTLEVDELERQLSRTFDDRLRSFEGQRVIVADEVSVPTSKAADGGR